MEKILTSIETLENIIIGIFTIYNLFKGVKINKNKKNLEKERDDLKQQLKQSNIYNNNNISNSVNANIHNETNINNEIFQLSEKLDDNTKSKKTAFNFAYRITMGVFIISFILYVIHYINERFNSKIHIESLNTVSSLLENILNILINSYKNAIIIILFINIIIAIVVFVISILNWKLKWKILLSSLLFGLLNLYVLINALNIDSNDTHYSIQEPKLVFIITFFHLMAGFITAIFSNYILYSYLFNSEFEDELFDRPIKRFLIWIALTVLFAFLNFINYHNGLQITLNFIKKLLNSI